MARLHENNIFISNGLKNSVNRPLMKDFYVNCQLFSNIHNLAFTLGYPVFGSHHNIV